MVASVSAFISDKASNYINALQSANTLQEDKWIQGFWLLEFKSDNVCRATGGVKFLQQFAHSTLSIQLFKIISKVWSMESWYGLSNSEVRE